MSGLYATNTKTNANNFLSININKDIIKRIQNTDRKIRSLTYIRRLVTLDPSIDLTSKQWDSVETLLFTIKKDLSFKLGTAITLKNFSDPRSIKKMNNIVAETEMKLDKAIKLFDTYLDLITQRQSKILGSMLGGCDVFAVSAMKQNHPILQTIETPITSFQGYYGAAVLRDGVRIQGYKIPNSLIQIPYSMLVSAYLLTSEAHEIGHIIQPKLGLDVTFPKMIYQVMNSAGVKPHIIDIFILWSKEIWADLFAFLCCGKAQSSIRDILSLSDDIVFNFSATDSHPSPFERVLLSFSWCRQLWGHGEWDEWEESWLKLYRLDLRKKNKRLHEELKDSIPLFSKGIMKSKIPQLNIRLIDLFEMSPLDPSNLRRVCEDPKKFNERLMNLKPHHQFAVFRHMYDTNLVSGRQCNRLIHKWLNMLNRKKGDFDL